MIDVEKDFEESSSRAIQITNMIYLQGTLLAGDERSQKLVTRSSFKLKEDL